MNSIILSKLKDVYNFLKLFICDPKEIFFVVQKHLDIFICYFKKNFFIVHKHPFQLWITTKNNKFSTHKSPPLNYLANDKAKYSLYLYPAKIAFWIILYQIVINIGFLVFFKNSYIFILLYNFLYIFICWFIYHHWRLPVLEKAWDNWKPEDDFFEDIPQLITLNNYYIFSSLFFGIYDFFKKNFNFKNKILMFFLFLLIIFLLYFFIKPYEHFLIVIIFLFIIFPVFFALTFLMISIFYKNIKIIPAKIKQLFSNFCNKFTIKENFNTNKIKTNPYNIRNKNPQMHPINTRPYSRQHTFLKVALADFYSAKFKTEKKDKWQKRSFLRWIIYWLMPVWANYFLLLFFLLLQPIFHSFNPGFLELSPSYSYKPYSENVIPTLTGLEFHPKLFFILIIIWAVISFNFIQNQISYFQENYWFRSFRIRKKEYGLPPSVAYHYDKNKFDFMALLKDFSFDKVIALIFSLSLVTYLAIASFLHLTLYR